MAAAGDAGDPVTVDLSAQAKVTLQLIAYSGTAASGPIASIDEHGASGGHVAPDAGRDRRGRQLGRLGVVGQAVGRPHLDRARAA